jgi:sigma-E factor negative regulatory protein RseA
MNDALKMQISVFVDGELPENESELLLRRLSQDATLRTQVAKYLQIGRLIRREREIPRMDELRKRIAMALGEQPDETPARPEQSRRRLLKPAAGFAIAASVAVVALVGLRQTDMPGALEPAGTATASQPSPDRVAGYTEPLPADALAQRPGDMLTQYYLSHGATSADLGANGILTRLVTLELREGELVEVAVESPGAESLTVAPDDTGAPEEDDDGSDADRR